MNVASVVLQIVGLGLLVTAGFLWAVPAGLAVTGVVLVLLGVAAGRGQ